MRFATSKTLRYFLYECRYGDGRPRFRCRASFAIGGEGPAGISGYHYIGGLNWVDPLPVVGGMALVPGLMTRMVPGRNCNMIVAVTTGARLNR